MIHFDQQIEDDKRKWRRLIATVLGGSIIGIMVLVGCAVVEQKKPVKTIISYQPPPLPGQKASPAQELVIDRPPDLGRTHTRTNDCLWWEQRLIDGGLITLPLTMDGKVVMYSVEQKDSIAGPWRVLAITNRPPVKVDTNLPIAFFRVGRLPL